MSTLAYALPTRRLVNADLLKLRRSRGLVVVTSLLTIGAMVITYGTVELLHVINAAKHGPAGGIVMLGHGAFVVAALGAVAAAIVGSAAGAGDLDTGVYRELVVTGRSRLALYASRIPAAIVGDEAARFDPPHPAARDNDAVLHIVFAPPLVEGLTTKRIQAPSIFRVQFFPPLTARCLGCPLGQPVDRRIPCRDLHLAAVDIVTVAADKSGRSRQCDLRIALGQRQLRRLAFPSISTGLSDKRGQAPPIAKGQRTKQ